MGSTAKMRKLRYSGAVRAGDGRIRQCGQEASGESISSELSLVAISSHDKPLRLQDCAVIARIAHRAPGQARPAFDLLACAEDSEGGVWCAPTRTEEHLLLCGDKEPPLRGRFAAQQRVTTRACGSRDHCQVARTPPAPSS